MTHNWLFHENELTGKWHAAKREDAHLLFNDSTNPKVLRSSNINTLREIIRKTDGDTDRLFTGKKGS